MPTTDFETRLYRTAGPVATITLNRPEALNTIVPPVPDENRGRRRPGRAGPRRQGHRAARRRPGVLRRLRLLIVNQAYENMGLAATQTLGGFLDGLMRNTSDALDVIQTAATKGVRAAVERRDGPFGDYSQAPAELRPDPSHIITP